MQHPVTVQFQNRKYYATGKTGTHIASGEHVAEYQCSHEVTNFELRVWHRTPSNIVYED